MRLNLSLKAALSAAFGLLTLLCAGQGALSILKTSDIRRGIAQAATNWLPSIIAIDRTTGAASKLSRQAETIAPEVGQVHATVRAA